MDCNREEALRAMQIAEKKMENKDFSGALKIAVKAQQLYPELVNINQMILVCEVHCSAEKKTYGSEKDWYAILKIDPTADDLSVKRQYRKFALFLHPDKNKFSGSTDAFKLIGEAQRVLLDREKRTIHDNKRRAFTNSWAPRQPNVHQHPWNQGHSGNYTAGRTGSFQFQKVTPTGTGSGVRLTFWTVCPYCAVRYQFYRDDVHNKVIHCQSCKKSFTAYELNVPGPSPAPVPEPKPKTVPVPIPVPKRVPVPVPKPERKQKKKVDESSESSDAGNSSESEEEEENSTESDENTPEKTNKIPENQEFKHFGEQPRRSARPKRNVSYTENVEDDPTPSKKRAPSPDLKPEDAFWKAEVRELESDPEDQPEVFECPDPEFNDFEKDRKENSFASGQVWAVYDTEDAMPRFYAFIRKVTYSSFNLQITWLKPVPGTDDETSWVNEELPVSCGKFTRGKRDTAEDLPMFSHLVSNKSIAGGFLIIPKKGETWAVFRDWNINWSNDGTRKYEYEFVEVLSDFEEGIGFGVWFLEKVAGFRCLFGRRDDGEEVIPASDRYRFSHMVPCCRMSGEEREGVPKGCFELDPAGLPASAFE